MGNSKPWDHADHPQTPDKWSTIFFVDKAHDPLVI